MGNHMSCVSPAALNRLQAASDCSSRNLIKFLHVETGDISELAGPLTAAEVMMEFPAQFLSCVSIALSNGRRITALPADEELRADQELYLLLPMHKLNTRFSIQEMAFFASLDVKGKEDSGKKSRRGAMNSQSKIAPLPAAMSAAKSSNTESRVGQSLLRSSSFKGLDSMALEGHAASRFMIGGGARRNVMCRSKSWIPKLETIRESAVVS